MSLAAAHPTTLTQPDREIVMTRTFDAPRSLVFDTWTQPELLRRCFDSSVSCDIDLRVGGAYRFIETGPDGEVYPLKGVFKEIARPDGLVYTQGFDDESCASREVTISLTLAEHGGQTQLTLSVLCGSTEDRDAHLNAGIEPGVTKTLERLGNVLGRLRHQGSDMAA